MYTYTYMCVYIYIYTLRRTCTVEGINVATLEQYVYMKN